MFHGDVHAGNLFITPDGKIAFLDFGIMGRLDEHARRVLRKALPAVLIENDYDAVIRGGVRVGRGDPPGRPERRHRTMWPSSSGRCSTGRCPNSATASCSPTSCSVAVRYHVRLPRELVLVVKQLLYFERYAKELAPDYPLSPTRASSSTSSASAPRPIERPPAHDPPGHRDHATELAVARDPRARSRSRGTTTATGPS